MKRRVFLLAIVVVLALATTVAAAKSEPAFGTGINKTGTIDLLFDGYCDGVSFGYDTGTGLLNNGYYQSSCATCPSPDRMGGTVGIITGGQGVGATMGWETLFGGAPVSIFTVIRADHTWTHYDWSGSVMNSGTWTACGAGASAPVGAPRSIDR